MNNLWPKIALQIFLTTRRVSYCNRKKMKNENCKKFCKSLRSEHFGIPQKTSEHYGIP